MASRNFPLLSVVFAVCALPLFSLADNGMDMSMDGAMSLDAGNMMTPYLHFTPGDTLLFYGWVPRKGGAVAGACVGLFLLAVVERWVGAIRGVAGAAWARRAQIEHTNRLNALPQSSSSTTSVSLSARPSQPELKQRLPPRPSLTGLITTRTMPPFIPALDILRGVMYAVQTALGFVFMLAVMTFNAAFIISIVIGLGVGETLFGRYAAAVGQH